LGKVDDLKAVFIAQKFDCTERGGRLKDKRRLEEEEGRKQRRRWGFVI